MKTTPVIPEDYTIYPLGDGAMTIGMGEQISAEDHARVMAMRRWVDANRFEGLLDCIVAYSSLTVLYDLAVVARRTGVGSVGDFVRAYLLRAYHESVSFSGVVTGRLLQIPVCYEDPFSPDMADVCALTGLTREAVIALHTGRTYRVYMVGFLPGFAYLASVDERLAVGRKQRPRARVEAGSVGIAGVQTGIYPVVSPGGWQIIGRTPVTLFRPAADPPVLLTAGDDVRFYAIERSAYEQHMGVIV